MAEITTNFRDKNYGDLGKNLVSKEYLQSVYPKLSNSLYRGNLVGSFSVFTNIPQWAAEGVPNSWKYVVLESGTTFAQSTFAAININDSAWTVGRVPGGTGFRSSLTSIGGKNDRWKSISVSSRNLIGVKTDGTLWVSGNDNSGQFGAWTAVSGVRQEHTSSTNWKTVCTKGDACFGIKTDGTLWSWGSNISYNLGRTGQPFMDIPGTPAAVSSLAREFTSSTNWKKVYASDSSVLALKIDGSLWTWGRYNGLTNHRIYQHLSTPSLMTFGNSNFKTLPTVWSPADIPTMSVSSVSNFIKNDGSLWSWGDNRMGLFATNNYVNVRPHSMRREVSSSINWKQIDVNSAGSQSIALGLKTDGTLWRWGANYGDYPPGGRNVIASPQQISLYGLSSWLTFSAAINSGTYNSKLAAISSVDNSLWIWGGSYLVGNWPFSAYNAGLSPVRELSFSTNWSSVSFGNDHLAGIKSDGTLWTIGGNRYGQLGNNVNSTATGQSIPIREFTSSTNWKQVSASTNFTLALKTDGTIWGWGLNSSGQLGTNDIVTRSTPSQEFTSSTNWKFVSVSGAAGFGIKNNGTLWAWGLNTYGQLGTNDTIQRLTAVQEFTSSTNWNYICRSVANGEKGIMAVKNDGTLWGWGTNEYSQLGIESGTYLITPVREYTNSTWIDVDISTYLSSAGVFTGIKSNGTLWTKNTFFNIHVGNSSPLMMIEQGKSWKSCSSGATGLTALATDGTVYRSPSVLKGSSGRFVQLAKGSDAGSGPATAIEFET